MDKSIEQRNGEGEKEHLLPMCPFAELLEVMPVHKAHGAFNEGVLACAARWMSQRTVPVCHVTDMVMYKQSFYC